MADQLDQVTCHLDSFIEYDQVKHIIKQIKQLDQAQGHQSGHVFGEIITEKFQAIINVYQQLPQLLDPHLQPLFDDLIHIIRTQTDDIKVKLAFRFLYLITKVRGFKVAVRFLPHEVSDVEPVLCLLEKQVNGEWQTEYMLLLWLSILAMTPFHLDKFDVPTEDGHDSKPTLMSR